MLKRIFSLMVLMLLLIGMLTLAFNIQPAKAEGGTIYIRAEGSINPPTANITTIDNATYTFTGNIFNQSIVVQRDNIVVDGAGFTLQGTGSGTGINLSGRSNVTIKNMEIKGFDSGIHLWVSSNNSIIGNTITSNFHGLSLSQLSSNNIISENIITNNTYEGIELYVSSNNSIVRNTITSNQYGIWLHHYSDDNYSAKNTVTNNTVGIRLSEDAKHNRISGNDILANGIGIGLVAFAENNLVYHNNFINNTEQVDTYPWISNVWDSRYPSGGNYWSDYTVVDDYNGPFQNMTGSDGIGDTPYVIDADNQDHYPLMHPWSPLPVHNINTGLGYATIQEAINANETLDRHIIFVESGTYYENVVVNKSVSLIGGNRETTIIDGNGTGNVVYIIANNVTLSGFAIRNCGSYPESGVYLDESNYSAITCNVIIANNWYGVRLEYSSYNRISGNDVTNNYNFGVYLNRSNNNVLSENNITNNLYGIGLTESSGNTLTNNNVTNTTTGIFIDRSVNNTLTDNKVSSNQEGIWLAYSNGNTLTSNIASYNDYGIWLFASDNNTLTANIASNNREGIELFDNSYNNILTSNNVSSNQNGILLFFSDSNRIFHNNFINNTRQAYSCASTTVWDDGYPSGGNYWSNYTGVDLYSSPYQNETGGDGIGDSPYVIDANNTDRYPLMNPWGTGTPVASFVWFPSVPEVDEVVTFDASASMPNGGEIVSYEWDFGDGNYASGKIVTHRYHYIGNYSVTLNVTDSEGLWDIEQRQIEVKAPPPPLTVSISPASASILVGQSVTFTSTVSGGYTPYAYQWYLNGNPVSGATSNTWTFTPTTGGIYYIYLKVTDAKGNTAQSDAARITVTTVPVGGYSIPIQLPTTAKPLTPYIALLTILTAIFTTIKRKTKRKH